MTTDHASVFVQFLSSYKWRQELIFYEAGKKVVDRVSLSSESSIAAGNNSGKNERGQVRSVSILTHLSSVTRSLLCFTRSFLSTGFSNDITVHHTPRQTRGEKRLHQKQVFGPSGHR